MLARRRALSAPAVRPARSDLLGVSQAPPPLYIPSVPRSVITPPVDAPPPATSAPPAPEVHPAQEPSPVPALPPPSYDLPPTPPRSEEHTSELQSLMRISYAVFCLKKKQQKTRHTNHPL